jgi:hypothetical protein
MYGAAEESDYEPPAKSQKIRTEATSAVAGEAILSKGRPAHAVLSLTRGQVNAVRAAFKAGIAPPELRGSSGFHNPKCGRC